MNQICIISVLFFNKIYHLMKYHQNSANRVHFLLFIKSLKNYQHFALPRQCFSSSSHSNGPTFSSFLVRSFVRCARKKKSKSVRFSNFLLFRNGNCRFSENGFPKVREARNKSQSQKKIRSNSELEKHRKTLLLGYSISDLHLRA